MSSPGPCSDELAVIARDEAAHIQRLPAGVAQEVDRMVVPDTGSTEATALLAATRGAQVHPLAWLEDLQADRNASLAHAAGDWHVVLDADEGLNDAGAALAEVRTCTPVAVGVLLMNGHIDDGTPGTVHA